MDTRSLPFLLLLAGLWVAPSPAAAQQPPPTPPAQQPPTELVFEREIFAYPSFQRRNPFQPLTGADQGGPRYEQLRLLGIIFSEVASESVAIVGTSTIDVSEDGTEVTIVPGQSWYLKTGQAVGNTRIVEIRRDQVVVDVEEFGLTEQKIMQAQTRRLGGTP